jgi:hypothetical protein
MSTCHSVIENRNLPTGQGIDEIADTAVPCDKAACAARVAGEPTVQRLHPRCPPKEINLLFLIIIILVFSALAFRL